MRQDWYLKLDKEGREITPEMGKPTFMSKKKFIEDTEKKVEKREEILARISKDRAAMKASLDTEEDKGREMIISDSDD